VNAKPLEPGCLAMSRARHSMGVIVTVIKYMGIDPPNPNWGLEATTYKHGWWLLDQKVSWSKNEEPYLPTQLLMRIDDPGIQKEIEYEMLSGVSV
jgi:hypothetical protein